MPPIAPSKKGNLPAPTRHASSESLKGKANDTHMLCRHLIPPDTKSPERAVTAIEPPEAEEQEAAGDKQAQVAESQTKSPTLTTKEIEDLASRLATERVKHIKDVADPFEAWEKARSDILSHMAKSR